MHSIVNWLWVFGVLALVFAWYKARYVNRQDPGTERMAEIASFIREGAIAFLKREYSVLAVFAGAVAVLLFVANYQNGTALVGVSFIVGAICSGLAGVFGMRVATRANVRAAAAARDSLSAALERRVLRRRGHGHVRRRPRGPRAVDPVRRLLQPLRHRARRDAEQRPPGALRVQPRRLLDRAVRPRRRRYLHEVGRRRSRPRGQGRGGHPRGRPPQPGGHRRPRGRQRGRRVWDGGRPLRVLRGRHHRRHGPGPALRRQPGRRGEPAQLRHPAAGHRRVRDSRAPSPAPSWCGRRKGATPRTP